MRHDVRSIAREASAAPAASFKRDFRTLGFPRLYGAKPDQGLKVVEAGAMKDNSVLGKAVSHIPIALRQVC